MNIVDPSTLPPVRCEIRPRRDGRGYFVRVEVRSVQHPEHASQTNIDPGQFLSARDLSREVQKQAARLAVHIMDTLKDAKIDVDEVAAAALPAFEVAAIELHNAELKRAS